MSITITKRIRVSFTFLKGTDGAFLSRCGSVLKGTTGNSAYPSSPVDPAGFKTALDSLTTLVVDALDGGRKAIAARVAQRGVVTKMLRSIGHYVEVACNDDLNTFLSSGFEPLTIVRVPQEPVAPAMIRNIDHGSTGQLLVSLKSVPNAFSYQLRFAPLAAANAGGPWVFQSVASVRQAAACNGLTPGTTYVFQVQTLGKLGFSDWSNSVTKMCT